MVRPNREYFAIVSNAEIPDPDYPTSDDSMLTRREYLKNSALLAAACALPAGILEAFDPGALITRPIPSSGEKLPIVGLGSSATFRKVAQSEDVSALASVIKTLVENGGTVLDTAPSYGASEEVSGRIAREGGMTEKIFWATKVNVVRRGGSSADPEAARTQVERSFERLGKDPIDLIQVHNLAGLPTQMGIIKELKEEGRIRYIGTTSTRHSRYPDLEKAMRDYPLDFIGVDYAVDNRLAAERILPLAEELGIAAETVASKRELSAVIISGNRHSRVFSGWRADVIGGDLVSLM